MSSIRSSAERRVSTSSTSGSARPARWARPAGWARPAEGARAAGWAAAQPLIELVEIRLRRPGRGGGGVVRNSGWFGKYPVIRRCGGVMLCLVLSCKPEMRAEEVSTSSTYGGGSRQARPAEGGLDELDQRTGSRQARPTEGGLDKLDLRRGLDSSTSGIGVSTGSTSGGGLDRLDRGGGLDRLDERRGSRRLDRGGGLDKLDQRKGGLDGLDQRKGGLDGLDQRTGSRPAGARGGGRRRGYSLGSSTVRAGERSPRIRSNRSSAAVVPSLRAGSGTITMPAGGKVENGSSP